MAHLLVSAAHKSSGKTTVSIGLCAALRAQGRAVQPFKKGPDYIDPMWLARAAGRPCHNLDFYTMDTDEIRDSFARSMRGADIGLIEGNKGLYDGLDLDGSNSNAALATLLQAPVVLVIDARGMTRGVAPLILGYQAFDANVNIAGVILNRLGGRRHESKLRAVIEHYTELPVLGAILQDPAMEIDERHLGLVPSNEASAVDQRIADITARITDQVDLARLAALAAQAPAPAPVAPLPSVSTPSLRIGVIRDQAFGFYYADDLEALSRQGAELVFIDALRDRELPPVDGLFIGGGFPETHVAELAANASFRDSLRLAVEQGLPVYAECGGLMYLCRGIHWQGAEHRMCGIIPADVRMHPRPQGRGYVRLRSRPGHPWHPGSGPDRDIAAHEFHYSSLENIDPAVDFAWEVTRGTGITGDRDGLMYRNVLACYSHLRDTGQYPWTREFLRFVRRCAADRAAAGA